MKIRIFAMMAILLFCSACGTPENKPTETAGITKTETVEPEAVPDYLDTLPVYDLSGGSITEEAGKAFFLGCGGDMAIKTESGVELLMTTSSSIEILDHLHEMLTDPSVYWYGCQSG